MLVFPFLLTYTFHHSQYPMASVRLSKGLYLFQLWGANGGNSSSTGIGGRGAYVSSYVNFLKNTDILAVIGSSGKGFRGGFNGGGNGFSCNSTYSGGGGGSTDVRVDDKSVSTRFIVAAGGSGASGSQNGFDGGGLAAKFTNQTIGNENGLGFSLESVSSSICPCNFPISGGGGGYRGGLNNNDLPMICPNTNIKQVSDGGSSFLYSFPGANPREIPGMDKIKILSDSSKIIDGSKAPNHPNGEYPNDGLLIITPIFEKKIEHCFENGEQYQIKKSIFQRSIRAIRRIKPWKL